MLDHLIAFLRTTLAATRADRHPLATEFDALRDYLALMAVRMGPRLQVQLDLPDELRAAAVPPLLLQPLVENAIKHGLEPKVEGGRIEVVARRQGRHLRAARARHRRRPGRGPVPPWHGLRPAAGAPAAGRLYGERPA
jgi:LytS/YehU family sensor histidine kinase